MGAASAPTHRESAPGAEAEVKPVKAAQAQTGEDWGTSGTFRVAPEARDVAEDAPRPRPRVFIVDSDDTNRELLAEFLDGPGYELVLVGSGDDALYQAEQCPPDIVLIDPLMPREDGFRLARMLKATGATHGTVSVPLLFVTALGDDDSRIRALDAGAAQLVKRPVDRHELRARVKSSLDLRAEHEALSAKNAQLKSLQRFKAETTAMLVHDLKSPLSAMMMNLDFALDDLSPQAGTADVRTALAESRAAGAKLFRMIANLLDIARSDDGRLVPRRADVDVRALFTSVANDHAAEAQARKVTITSEVLVDGPIRADPDMLGRMLANLVENALRFTAAGGKILLFARRACPEAAVELTVTHGASEGREVPYFCRVAAEAHGGRLDLFGDGSSGTCFRIELPPG